MDFKTWERRRRHLTPEPDRVVPLVRAAGGAGMTRRQLGGAVGLDRGVLDDLLAGLVSAGQLCLSWEDGVPVYRAGVGW